MPTGLGQELRRGLGGTRRRLAAPRTQRGGVHVSTCALAHPTLAGADRRAPGAQLPPGRRAGSRGGRSSQEQEGHTPFGKGLGVVQTHSSASRCRTASALPGPGQPWSPTGVHIHRAFVAWMLGMAKIWGRYGQDSVQTYLGTPGGVPRFGVRIGPSGCLVVAAQLRTGLGPDVAQKWAR